MGASVLREGRSEIRALWRARRTDLLVGGRGDLEFGGRLTLLVISKAQPGQPAMF